MTRFVDANELRRYIVDTHMYAEGALLDHEERFVQQTVLDIVHTLDAMPTPTCKTCRLPAWYERAGYGGHCMHVSHIFTSFCCNRWEARP